MQCARVDTGPRADSTEASDGERPRTLRPAPALWMAEAPAGLTAGGGVAGRDIKEFAAGSLGLAMLIRGAGFA